MVEWRKHNIIKVAYDIIILSSLPPPTQRNHGAPENFERHIGDLGNILADANGNANVDIEDPLVTLMGPRSVVGLAIVVHEGEDDLGTGINEGSLKTGNAGGRVGCGVIGHAASP